MIQASVPCKPEDQVQALEGKVRFVVVPDHLVAADLPAHPSSARWRSD